MLHFGSNRIILMAVILFVGIIPSVYADETGFQEPIIEVFKWFNEMMTGNIQNSDMNKDTKENLQNTLDAGTDAGATGTILWFKVHKFLVELIFAGTDEADLPVSKDMIVIIAMVIVFVALLGLGLHLLRQNTKIAIIVISILIIIGIIGITIEF